VDIPEEKRVDFYLYVDEFQNFATDAFCNILSEARKYRLSLILGNQYLAQLDEMAATGKSTKVREAVFGNVGTIISFRVGAEDAEFLEKEFTPEFLATDFVNLSKYNIYLKLMINGVAGAPFSAETTPPIPKPEKSNKENIIKVSRERYSTSRNIIEEKIAKWTGTMESPGTSQTSQPSQPSQASSQVLYDVKCSLCGKWTKVIFPPDGTRPVYCKTCLKKVKGPAAPAQPTVPAQEKQTLLEKQEAAPGISLEEATTEEPVSFSSKKTQDFQRPKRKEVDLEELKKTLEESLKEIETKPETDENPKGV